MVGKLLLLPRWCHRGRWEEQLSSVTPPRGWSPVVEAAIQGGKDWGHTEGRASGRGGGPGVGQGRELGVPAWRSANSGSW